MAETINFNFTQKGINPIVKDLEKLSKYSKQAGKELESSMKNANKTMEKTNKLVSDRTSDEEKILNILEKHNLNLDQTLRQERTMKTILADYKRDWADVNKSTKSASRFVSNFLEKSNQGFTGKVVSGARGFTDTMQFMGSTMGVIGAQFAPIIAGLKLFTGIGKGIIGLFIGADYELTNVTKSLYQAAAATGDIEKAIAMGKTGAISFKADLKDIARAYKINIDDLYEAVTEFGRQGGNVLRSQLGDGAFQSPAEAIAQYSRLFQMETKEMAGYAAQLGTTFGNTAENISGGLETIFKNFNNTGIQASKFLETVIQASESMSLYGNTTSLTSRILNKMANATLSSVNAIKLFNKIQEAGPEDEGVQFAGIQDALVGSQNAKARQGLIAELQKRQGLLRGAVKERLQKEGKGTSEAEVTKALQNTLEFNNLNNAISALEGMSKGLSYENFLKFRESIDKTTFGLTALSGLVTGGKIKKQDLFTYAKAFGLDAMTLSFLANQTQGSSIIQEMILKNDSKASQEFKETLKGIAGKAAGDTTSVMDTIGQTLADIKTTLTKEFSPAISQFSSVSKTLLSVLGDIQKLPGYRILTGRILDDLYETLKGFKNGFDIFGTDREAKKLDQANLNKNMAKRGREYLSDKLVALASLTNRSRSGLNAFKRLEAASGTTMGEDFDSFLSQIEGGHISKLVESKNIPMYVSNLKSISNSLDKIASKYGLTGQQTEDLKAVINVDLKRYSSEQVKQTVKASG